ncbi:50S ribosomal protein L7/L12 [Pseudomonas sp. GM30]|uniref:50S ribosomal protein L7/L12 n=1 Tax=Pseudomonas sp. GM30 TaxID=1144328 RepID=UPI00026FE2A6|nr:50S ribosomal protein L7/L12 [Pseudomonas sp. GM30]EUB85219.1 ribosomal protein L7/L12 [Pseudomonas sp. GM30]
MVSKLDILDALSPNSVLQTDALEEKFGTTKTVPNAAAPSDSSSDISNQSRFTVILEPVEASQKVAVIKMIRECTGLGLKEAKELVDSAPKPVEKELSKTDAEALKKKLEAVGATASLKQV